MTRPVIPPRRPFAALLTAGLLGLVATVAGCSDQPEDGTVVPPPETPPEMPADY